LRNARASKSAADDRLEVRTGVVSGACFSEFGVSVSWVDQDAAKIAGLQRGEMPV
jgi:UDP-glucose 6-dehydrogenase